MTKSLFLLLLAAALGLLAGCSTPKISPSGAVASTGSSAQKATSAAATDAGNSPGAPGNGVGNVGITENPAGGRGLREFERGQASWYGPRFHGRRTASGERYDQHAMTAAHRTLPFGTLLRVRSLLTGKEIEVRVNDRGPFMPGRIIDISQAAAEAIGLTRLGVKPVALLLVPGRSSQTPALPRLKAD